MASEITLVVQGDDFGMCHAVNEGIAVAFTQGILRQTSAMVPCPWFDEAARLKRELDLPAGMHSTLTCEWANFRWRPLTTGASLVAEDGTPWRSVADARSHITEEDAATELRAQAARFEALMGVPPIDVDPHMGVIRRGAYRAVCDDLDVGFIYPIGACSLRWDSIRALSERPSATKKAWLLAYIDGLGPGSHFLCTHPAVASAELDALTVPTAHDHPWTTEYRVSDLAVLTDPEVIDAVERRGIRLASVADLDLDREPADSGAR